MPKLLSYVTVLFGLVFFIAGSWLLYVQVLQGRKETEAEILSGEVERFEQTEEGTTTTLYRSKYEVSFTAEGRFFRRPLQGNFSSNNAGDIQKRLSRNPPGSRRPIYYLRARPESFVLEGLSRRIGTSFLFMAIGVTVMAVGALLLYQAQPLEW
jgi:hypothetical protein